VRQKHAALLSCTATRDSEAAQHGPSIPRVSASKTCAMARGARYRALSAASLCRRVLESPDVKALVNAIRDLDDFDVDEAKTTCVMWQHSHSRCTCDDPVCTCIDPATWQLSCPASLTADKCTLMGVRACGLHTVADYRETG